MAKDVSKMGPIETVYQSVTVPQSGYGMKPVFALGAFAALVVIPGLAIGAMSTAQGLTEHADQQIAAESVAEQPGGADDPGVGAPGTPDATEPGASDAPVDSSEQDSDDPNTSVDDRDAEQPDTDAPGSEPSEDDPDRGSDQPEPLTGESVASGELFYDGSSRPTQDVIHIVEPGDTLSNISGFYGVSLDAIAEYNAIADPNVIYIDAALVIPYSVFD